MPSCNGLGTVVLASSGGQLKARDALGQLARWSGTGVYVANGQRAQEDAGHDLAGLFRVTFAALDTVARVSVDARVDPSAAPVFTDALKVLNAACSKVRASLKHIREVFSGQQKIRPSPAFDPAAP